MCRRANRVSLALVLMVLAAMAGHAEAADQPPRVWGEAEGNPFKVDGQARWRADRLWPAELKNPEAYQPLTWESERWAAKEHHHAGQPAIRFDHGVVHLETRTAWPINPGHKWPALVYIASEPGIYYLEGQAEARMRTGNPPARLHMVRRTAESAEVAHSLTVDVGEASSLSGLRVELEAGDELAFVAVPANANSSAVVELSELAIGIGFSHLSEASGERAKAVADLRPIELVAKPTPEQLDAANSAVVKAMEPGREAGIVFPVGARVANVKAYGAVGDGKHDDTAAFRAALEANPKNTLIYVPDGTYLITDSLRWGRLSKGDAQKRQILQGQSTEGTILRVPDHCPGFGDVQRPRAVIWTGQAPAQRFRNSIRHLTVDTGAGNPGAIGVRFIANNQGGMFHVDIRSSDPDRVGLIGLDLGYTNEQGPCLITNVRVTGFDVGLFTKHAVDGVTLENITLREQRVVGFRNDGQSIAMRGLHSVNRVPAYENLPGASLTAMIDSELIGEDGASERPAIINGRGLFARNVKTSGYAKAIENTDGHQRDHDDPIIEEFVSHDVLTLFDTPLRSLNLPVVDTPEVPWGPLDGWVSVTDFGPPEKAMLVRQSDGKKFERNDWSGALQRAIDSGATTVYFPHDPSTSYGIYGTVVLRGKVRRLIGCESSLGQTSGGAHQPHLFEPESRPTFILEDGEAPAVIVERFNTWYTGSRFLQQSKRDLIISSMSFYELTTQPEAGDVHLVDVRTMDLNIHGSRLFGRQVNTEAAERPRCLNDGGVVWMLGIKTEGDAPIHHVTNGGQSELVGGFIYANKNFDPEKVMFVIDETSFFSATVGEWVIRQQPFAIAEQTRQGQTKRLEHGDTPARGQGSLVPLFVAQPTP